MSSPAESTTPPAAPAPVITRTEVTWRGERLFDAGPAGRTHRIDVEAKEAPGPVETLLNALATCSGIDVIDIIAKRKTPVERMTIHVAAERRPEAPRRVRHLDIEFRIDGAGIEREQPSERFSSRSSATARSRRPSRRISSPRSVSRSTARASRRSAMHIWTPRS